MTRIYATRLEAIGEDLSETVYPFLDGHVQKKICRLRKKEDKMRTLLAHAIVKMVLSEELQREPQDIPFKMNEYGKQGLAGEERQFNITHSGEFILAAIGDKPVGIDVEKNENRDFSLFRDIWGEGQHAHFELNDCRSFYKVWTAKESYAKYLGTGLHSNMEEIILQRDNSIIDQGKETGIAVKYIHLHRDYTCAVCSKEEIESITFVERDKIENFFISRRQGKDATYFS